MKIGDMLPDMRLGVVMVVLMAAASFLLVSGF